MALPSDSHPLNLRSVHGAQTTDHAPKTPDSAAPIHFTAHIQYPLNPFSVRSYQQQNQFITLFRNPFMDTKDEANRRFPNVFNPLDSHGLIHDSVSSCILRQLALYYGSTLEADFDLEFRTAHGMMRRKHLFAVGVLEADGTVHVQSCEWMSGRVWFVEGRKVVDL